jgi:hypothetical protein
VVELLLGKLGAQSSNPSTTQKKEKRKKTLSYLTKQGSLGNVPNFTCLLQKNGTLDLGQGMISVTPSLSWKHKEILNTSKTFVFLLTSFIRIFIFVMAWEILFYFIF